MNFFPEETNGIVKIAILSFQKLTVSCPICPLEIFAFIYMYTYIHTYIHTYIYIYIYIYIERERERERVKLTLYVHACCEAVHLC